MSFDRSLPFYAQQSQNKNEQSNRERQYDDEYNTHLWKQKQTNINLLKTGDCYDKDNVVVY